jgi:hypothetical protein
MTDCDIAGYFRATGSRSTLASAVERDTTCAGSLPRHHSIVISLFEHIAGCGSELIASYDDLLRRHAAFLHIATSGRRFCWQRSVGGIGERTACEYQQEYSQN